MSEAEKPTPRAVAELEGRSHSPVWSQVLRGSSLYFGLAVIFVVGCLADEQGTFLTRENQRDVLRGVSQVGILAVGMTLVIITAGIDLSVGRMLGFGSVLAAMLLVDKKWTAATWVALPAAATGAGILAALLALAWMGRKGSGGRAGVAAGVAFIAAASLLAAWTVPQVSGGLSIPAVVIVVPLTGMMLGGLSGLIIAKCRLQPFIVTLAMMTSAYGAARLVASSGGPGQVRSLYDSQGNVPEGVGALSHKIYDLIPVQGLFFLVCLAAGAFILGRLRFGRYVYAIGGNEETARLSGINVDRVKISVYAISGMLACLAGVLACDQFEHGKPELGQMNELDAIAAVVIGGTSLMGGRGRMAGTLVGVLIFGYLTNILSLRGLSTDVQLFVTGIIIVVAVLLQEGYVQRLPRQWRARVMFALFFALGGLLYILRAEMGLIYWQLLCVVAVVFFFVRLWHEWNWIDPAVILVLCGLSALVAPFSLAAVLFVAAMALLAWSQIRHRRASPQ